MMKMKLLAGVFGAVILVAGCVDTVSGGKTAGVPFVNDKFGSLYRVPRDVVFQAAKDVVKDDGVLTNEGTNYEGTNEVKFVQGKIGESKVWISVASADSDLTRVTVQTRRDGGGTDMMLAHQVDKEIAVKMARK
jgi:hypothetical protein